MENQKKQIELETFYLLILIVFFIFVENYLSFIYSEQFKQLAKDRRKTIQDLFWNDEFHLFMDYDFMNNQHTSILSLAGFYPLLFHIDLTRYVVRTCM